MFDVVALPAPIIRILYKLNANKKYFFFQFTLFWILYSVFTFVGRVCGTGPEGLALSLAGRTCCKLSQYFNYNHLFLTRKSHLLLVGNRYRYSSIGGRLWVFIWGANDYARNDDNNEQFFKLQERDISTSD